MSGLNSLTRLKLYFANNLLYILTLVPTKLSICLLFLRITTRNRHVIAIQTIMAICTTWGIMSVLLVCIGVSLTDTLHVTVSWESIRLVPGLAVRLLVGLCILTTDSSRAGLRLESSTP